MSTIFKKKSISFTWPCRHALLFDLVICWIKRNENENHLTNKVEGHLDNELENKLHHAFLPH